MWRFESIETLNHLLWLVVFGAVFFYSFRRWKVISTKIFGSRVSKYVFESFSEKKIILKFILACSAFAFFVLAQARPQAAKGQTEVKSEGVEVMLVVDVSKSMLSEDVRPNRLEHSKREILRLLDLLGGDKVGLIAFAGSSVLLSPLTVDKSALRMYVEGLSPDTVESQGTEIAKALSEAREAFLRGGQESDEKTRVTKVVVLISDGEDHEAGAEVLAKELTEKGIRIFTMAVGTEAGGKVVLRDPRGNMREYLKDKSGEPVVSRVKGDFLRSLASTGKGGFYHLTFGGDAMTNIKDDLDRLEKSQFDTLVAANYDEQFQWPLTIALVLALIELCLGTRKKLSKEWQGRFPI